MRSVHMKDTHTAAAAPPAVQRDAAEADGAERGREEDRGADEGDRGADGEGRGTGVLW